MDDVVVSYRDPYWTQLAQGVEQKLDLPAGLLQSIITRGERSNADQVSEAGARTVAQIIPATRKAALEKWGVDAYLGDGPNAIEVAGHLLKDSLDRNDGDVKTAVAEYHGGTDPANWGPRTKAYVGRVLGGQQQVQDGLLSNDFAAFMAANPATPPDSQRPPPVSIPGAPPQAAGAAPDALSQDFGAYMTHLAANGGRDNPIPDTTLAPSTPDAPQSPVDTAIGAGEAGLHAITGMAAGYPAGVASEALDYANAIKNWAGGHPELNAGGDFDKNAQDAAGIFTYQPRTEAGKQLAGSFQQWLADNATPLAGLGPEMGALAAGARPVAGAVRDVAAAGPEVVAQAAAAARDAAAKLGLPVGADAAQAPATPGTLTSAGAAATDLATQRVATAQSMPVPIDLMKGQATRDFAQQRFEQETAKDPTVGAPLRDRYAQQNQDILRNFDHFVDQTGAEAPTLRATGETVDAALKQQMQADKNAVRVAYKKAESAGEMEQPVSLDAAVQHLNDQAPAATTAPILDAARKFALKLGVATEDDAGNLEPQPVSLAIAEQYRKAINRATNYEPTNVYQATALKSAIDQATEGLGGNLYQQARAQRSRFAQNYENRATIAKLLDTQKGTTDRSVALEDVFQHTILNSSKDDVANVRRVLQRAGPTGWQAWRELQGATMRYIRDQATSNVSSDVRGNPIVSAAKLNQAVRGLDHDGKLDFVFGKKGGQQIRDLVDLAKVVYTSPPGAVNSSNTASVILAAIAETGITGSMTGLPVPVLSGLRLIAQQVKNRRIQQRVAEALGQQAAKPAARPRTVH